MFHEFERVWTPVALSNELRGQGPLAVQIANEKVVLFRDQNSTLGALMDRCPHRGVALSAGRIEGDCLRCPFHGWSFATDGRNTNVPWHPKAKRELLSAMPLAARDLGGMLWIYTAPGVTPTSEPQPVPELLRPGVVRTASTFVWNVHWTRAVENMLDDSHLPFVHPRTIGRSMQNLQQAQMEVALEESPSGFRWRTSIDGRQQEYATEFCWPNMMYLHIPVPGKQLGIYFASIPLDEFRTRILQISVRNFARVSVMNPIFRWINRKVLLEDRRVVETSWPLAVPPPSQERSVPTDEPSLRFRKRYFNELRKSQVEI